MLQRLVRWTFDRNYNIVLGCVKLTVIDVDVLKVPNSGLAINAFANDFFLSSNITREILNAINSFFTFKTQFIELAKREYFEIETQLTAITDRSMY